MALTDGFAKPTTPDEERLASCCFAHVRAQGVQGEEVWEAAAKMYNLKLSENLEYMRRYGQPAPGNYMYRPIGRAQFKKYWEELSARTVVQRAGAEAALLPQAVAGWAGGAGGPAGGAAVASPQPPTVLPYNRVVGLSDNSLRKECRARGIGIANKTKRPVLN